jgi:ABC-type nitrate/sulfonate/bicarbonate transport system substrate-binding protein
MTTIAGIELDLNRDIPSPESELWYTRCPVPTAFEVSLETGALPRAVQDAGLAWLQLADSDDPAVHQSHFTHRKANSFRHGGNVPAIWARAGGADTRVIGISWPRASYPVLALPGSGIRSPADLAGRRLLVPRRPEVAIDFWQASTWRVYESALAAGGLTFADVEIVEVSGTSQIIAGADAASREGRRRWAMSDRNSFTRAILGPLVRGEVDAITAQTTMAEEVIALTGAHVVYQQADARDLLARTNNGAPDVLTVSGQLASEQPELVAAVVGELLDAAEWARAHRDETFELLAQRLATPRPMLELAFGDDLVARLDVDLPEFTAAVLQTQHDSMLAHGFIDKPVDIAAWIDPRPLELARAARVRAHR